MGSWGDNLWSCCSSAVVYYFRCMKSRVRSILFLLLITNFAAHGQITYETVQVIYDSPWTYKNLQLIPVRFKGPGTGKQLQLPASARLMSLSQGVASGKVKIREMQGG